MRVVVVGKSGAGKSTFAQALANAIGAPCVELDALYWGPAWTAVPPAQFEAAVLAATSGERWVVEGNYAAVRDLLWPRATHVVWLNHSRPRVFSRVLWRTLSRGLLRTRLSHGNRESLGMAFSPDSRCCAGRGQPSPATSASSLGCVTTPGMRISTGLRSRGRRRPGSC